MPYPGCRLLGLRRRREPDDPSDEKTALYRNLNRRDVPLNRPARYASFPGTMAHAFDTESRLAQVDQLMKRYAGGDDLVFEELYRAVAPGLQRFCSRLAATRSEADDLFQETLLRLHRARETYAAGSNTLHWAFAIARSVHRDRARYRRRRPEELGAASDAAEHAPHRTGSRHSPEADALARALAALVASELARMSEKNRVAYVLLKEKGLSVKAAAEVLGTTAPVVRQRAHRAYEHLRNALDLAGWEEIDRSEPEAA